MKTHDETIAVHMLKDFVEQQLNRAHDTSMYCIEVKPRNHPVHFTLLFSHVKGAPPREDIQALFAPFGKCNVRTKDHQMTYINFPRFEQVVAVLQTLQSAKLYFHDKLVLADELIPVQNSKLMLSFEVLIVDRFASILKSRCITKHNLTSWFNAVKQNENCDKTWEQLVDFVSECIARKFGWTYHAQREMFCEHKMRHKNGLPGSAPGKKTQSLAPGMMASSVKSPWLMKPECVQEIEKEAPHAVNPQANALAVTIDDTAALVCQTKHHAVDVPRAVVGRVAPGASDQQCPGGDAEWLEDLVCQQNEHDKLAAPLKPNLIPLYGDEESHPLHQKLCSLERQLFGKSEDSSTSIHYRMHNMEMMMNINNETEPTCVRISQLVFWIQQYSVVVGHVAAVDTGGGLWELKVV